MICGRILFGIVTILFVDVHGALFNLEEHQKFDLKAKLCELSADFQETVKLISTRIVNLDNGVCNSCSNKSDTIRFDQFILPHCQQKDMNILDGVLIKRRAERLDLYLKIIELFKGQISTSSFKGKKFYDESIAELVEKMKVHKLRYLDPILKKYTELFSLATTPRAKLNAKHYQRLFRSQESRCTNTASLLRRRLRDVRAIYEDILADLTNNKMFHPKSSKC